MSAVPAQIQAILNLFSGSLSEVRFADLDREVLARLAAEVEQAASSAEGAQAELDRARILLQERHSALLQQAQRALAYARIYAESDATLGQQVEAIILPRASKKPRIEPEARGVAAAPSQATRRRGVNRSESLHEPTSIEASSAAPEPALGEPAEPATESSPVVSPSGRRGRRPNVTTRVVLDDQSEEARN